MIFINSQEAFEYYYGLIMDNGIDYNGTKTFFNLGFTIKNPLDNNIKTKWRKWSLNYADYEWKWYLSGNPNADEISKRAKIWKTMQDENGNVNSNYGYQWQKNNQLSKVINLLKEDKYTRRASISLYDGKDIDNYKKDTICTHAINFQILDNKINMSVMMRSNDLVYGFCNDQYCFSLLQKMIADELKIKIGTYYHFTNNMHIYQRHYNLKNKQHAK